MKSMENDNLISLGNIQEDNILKELQSRYTSNQIYVSSIIVKGLDATKPVFGVSDKARLKPACSATETS